MQNYKVIMQMEFSLSPCANIHSSKLGSVSPSLSVSLSPTFTHSHMLSLSVNTHVFLAVFFQVIPKLRIFFLCMCMYVSQLSSRVPLKMEKKCPLRIRGWLAVKRVNETVRPGRYEYAWHWLLFMIKDYSNIQMRAYWVITAHSVVEVKKKKKRSSPAT